MTPRSRDASRPEQHFDHGVQHERTALAWERTAVATMVAAAVFARYASMNDHLTLAVLGVLWVGVGGAVLLWSGWHYEELHGPLRAGESTVHVRASRLIGTASVLFAALALILAVYLVVIDR